MNARWLAMGLAVLAMCGGEAQAQKSRYERRWIYAAFNLQVNQQADELIALMERSAKAGFNGVLLADYKLNVLDRVTDDYFKNAARVKAAAERLKLELAPAVMPIGYSNGLLAHDANLAEGVPVIDAPFVVKNGEARLVRAAEPLYRGGNLDEVKGDSFVGVGYVDDAGKGSYADHDVKHGGAASCRLEGKGESENRRLIQGVTLRPHACYRLRAWIKTRDYQGSLFQLVALGGSADARTLSFYQGRPEATADWKQVEVVFNSLDQEKVNLYIGVWGKWSGTLWVDDITLEEVELTNVLRRAGTPFEVKSADGKTTYAEGKDFEPVVDPKLGQEPWAGEYKFTHDGPVVRLKSGSRIKDGETLRVSWYHPVIVYEDQVMCCLSDPKVEAILKDQIQRVEAVWHPKTYFMSHDEIRVMNWDKACQDRHLTPGQLLADNVRKCVALVKSVNPKAEIVTWSDMFDPFHNAVNNYYLVNGDLKGSWEGVPASVSIANWNGGKMRESLDFFAKRGHRQILAGHYDQPGLQGFTGWDQAAKGVKGVDGFMYTTWEKKYGEIEQYGEAMKASRD